MSNDNRDDITQHENECNCMICTMRRGIDMSRKTLLEQIEHEIDKTNRELEILLKMKMLAEMNPAINEYFELRRKYQEM